MRPHLNWCGKNFAKAKTNKPETASMRPHLNWCGKAVDDKHNSLATLGFNEAAPELVRKDSLAGTITKDTL